MIKPPLGINLQGSPPDAATFDGPLNVFIGLHGTGLAANQAAENKTLYDENFPGVVDPPPEEIPEPIGPAISPGQPITPNPDGYVIDTEIAQRVQKARR